MRPTRLGVKAVGFLLLLFVAFFVSPYSNLFFLQLAFYCVFLVQSAWWCRRNVARLRGRVVTPRPIPADSGDAVLECDVVAERHGARSVSVEIRRERRNTTRLSGIVDLPAGREGRHGFHLPPLPRGLHRARTVRLSSSFPFGLFRSSVALEGELELAVFPRPVEIVGLRSGGLAATVAALSGGVLVPGNDVVGHLRDWREGDSQRAVHWRATARRRRPVVKERDGDSGEGVSVVIDRRGDPEQVERALAELATLALAARERAESIEVFSQDGRTRYGDCAQPIDDLLRWLAAAEILPSDAPPPQGGPAGALRLPRASSSAPPLNVTPIGAQR
ncbi:MAG: DUF58 domain-containing protein [Planctomycetota bacterium]